MSRRTAIPPPTRRLSGAPHKGAWPLLLLIAAALLGALLLLRGLGTSTDLMRHTVEVQNGFARIGQGILAVESGQRGFLLTGDRRYLGLYQAELDELLGRLGQAVQKTRDDAGQQARLVGLGALLTEKLDELAQTIALAQDGRRDAALALVQTDRGRLLTQSLLAGLAALDQAEVALLTERTAAVLRERWMTALALSLALIAAGIATFLELRRTGRVIVTAAADRAELEGRVAERTAHLEQALQINRTLTEEVHHRAGNGLALVAGFLSLQASELEGEAADALEEARRRVIALAAAQRRLRVDTTTGDTDLVPYLRSILDDIRTALGPELTLTYEARPEPIVEPSGTAVSIGVIAGEMITNAVKHAFPRGLRGAIALRLGTAEGRLVLEVEDDGVGLDEAAQLGLGSRVLPALAELLGGTLERQSSCDDPARPGTLCRLQIPATPPHS